MTSLATSIPSMMTALPSGMSLPSGLSIPSGMSIPSGFSMPSGMNIPTSIPSGMSIPAGMLSAMTAMTAMPTAMPTGMPSMLPGNSSMPAQSGVTYGAHPYNNAAMMTFTIIGLIMQVPVLYTHSGMFSAPNIPVCFMSGYYLYIMLSFTVAAAHWSHGDTSQWWDGKGWCDLDSRLTLAVSLGALSAQCVINWNIIELLQDRPRITRGAASYWRYFLQTLACVFLPVLNLAVETFTTSKRYQITQDLGCSAVLDGSAALIVTNLMWAPILGAIACFTMLYIAWRFISRGRRSTLERVSFIPQMSAAQLIRMLVFAVVVTFVLVPLAVAVSAINFINIREHGVQPLAWKHGKPEGWDEIMMVTFAELRILAPTHLARATITVNFITMYVNIAIAWLIFLCYGTGALAMTAYCRLLEFVTKPWQGRRGLHGSRLRDPYEDDDESEYYDLGKRQTPRGSQRAPGSKAWAGSSANSQQGMSSAASQQSSVQTKIEKMKLSNVTRGLLGRASPSPSNSPDTLSLSPTQSVHEWDAQMDPERNFRAWEQGFRSHPGLNVRPPAGLGPAPKKKAKEPSSPESETFQYTEQVPAPSAAQPPPKKMGGFLVGLPFPRK